MGNKEKIALDSLLEIDKGNRQYGPLDPEGLKRSEQVRIKAEKEFRERFRNFEPYKLEEIEKIISKVKKDNANEKSEQKVSAFLIALEKIELIIKNSWSVYESLEKEGEISDPEKYWNELDEANNLKKQLEIEIAELRLETSKQAESNVEYTEKLSDSVPSEATISTSALSSNDDLLDVEGVARKLKISPSTVYHMVSAREIPYHKIGNGNRFIPQEIDNWVKEGKPRISLPEKTETGTDMKQENEKRFTFKIPLDPFTNVFVDKGYLDKDNAILMNDRFSKKPKLGNKFIEWKKDTRSLITFIYLADRLGLIDKSRSINVRAHNTSFAEPKENDEEGREIKYTNLVNENFVIDAESGSSDSMLTRWWNGTPKIKGINMIICELRIQAAVKSGLITKEEEEKANQKMTRKEAIEYYFAKKDSTNFKLDKDADRQMLDIVCEVMKSTENKSPNTTPKRPLLEFSSASL